MPVRGSLATIVIVNYNYERFVGTAIASALQQSYEPLEVIVVDDGSTDGSRRIISSYGGRIRAVFQENAGQGAAYNAGWREARGEFILFLDSDDVLAKDTIAKVVVAFQGSDAVKVQFYLRQVDGNLEPLGYLLPSYGFSRLEPRRQIRSYGYYTSPPASGNAFRKSFLDAIMPIANMEAYRRAADGYTTGLAGVAGRVVSIPEILGSYRLHGDNGGGEAGVKSLEQLHHLFMRDIKREDSQHAFGNQFDFHFPPNRSRYCPGHTKHRLLSRRLFPDAHPINSDTVGNLVFSGVVSAARFPHLKIARRFAVGMGFVLLGIVPRFLLQTHFRAIVSAQKRNRTAPDNSLLNEDIL
jgi:glycosyltransferase involved in cell wall biosynthesis